MFTLHNTTKTVAKKKKTLGRGEGSRLGKNAGKGHKGQTKRAGKLPVTFEGGRKSIVRRSPKFRGFKNSQSRVQELNTQLLSKYFQAGEVVSLQTLKDKGLMSSTAHSVRIIKKGDQKPAYSITEDVQIHLTKGVKHLTTI